METRKIGVRKEVARCAKCGKPSDFLYLSDFAYGERLASYNNSNPKALAYICLIENKVFDDFQRIVEKILKNYLITTTAHQMADILNKTFGITLDKIDGHALDYAGELPRQCAYCHSQEFEHLMIEPETFIAIEAPLITYDHWMFLNDEDKENKIEDELRNKGFI